MKFKNLAFALLVIPFVTTAAQAQNLFRTSRPDYTRDYPATYHDRYLANSDRITPANDIDYDRERLSRAWENYRAEAERYQTRYGSEITPTSYDSSSSLRPVDFDSTNYTPNRRCSRNRVPADVRPTLRPTLTAPSGYYNNPSYYDNDFGNASSIGNGSGFEANQYTAPYGTNLSRTASRPLTSLFGSLFGTNR